MNDLEHYLKTEKIEEIKDGARRLLEHGSAAIDDIESYVLYGLLFLYFKQKEEK